MVSGVVVAVVVVLTMFNPYYGRVNI
jgi:hypothetical protein